MGMTNMSKFSLIAVAAIVIGLLPFAAPPASASPSGGPLVWGVNPYDNSTEYEGGLGLYSFDASTGALISGRQLSIAGVPIAGDLPGANGLDVDPSTGTVYIAYKFDQNGNRALGTVDLSTGAVAPIG